MTRTSFLLATCCSLVVFAGCPAPRQKAKPIVWQPPSRTATLHEFFPSEVSGYERIEASETDGIERWDLVASSWQARYVSGHGEIEVVIVRDFGTDQQRKLYESLKGKVIGNKVLIATSTEWHLEDKTSGSSSRFFVSGDAIAGFSSTTHDPRAFAEALLTR
ncbi:MAG: hypothetical protein AB8G99_09545 [Planctomycetaceae bacterium]